MSLSLTYVVPGGDVAQLADELTRAGLVPETAQFAVVTVPDPSPPALPALPTNTEEDTVFLTFPDGTSEAAVDAVVAAHIPQARYDPATLLREWAPLLRANRRKGAWRRLEAQAAGATTVDALRLCVVALVDELAARDREEAG